MTVHVVPLSVPGQRCAWLEIREPELGPVEYVYNVAGYEPRRITAVEAQAFEKQGVR